MKLQSEKLKVITTEHLKGEKDRRTVGHVYSICKQRGRNTRKNNSAKSIY